MIAKPWLNRAAINALRGFVIGAIVFAGFITISFAQYLDMGDYWASYLGYFEVNSPSYLSVILLTSVFTGVFIGVSSTPVLKKAIKKG